MSSSKGNDRFDEFDREVFANGQVIFSHGDMGDCAYLIEEGSVEILVNKPDGEHRIRLIGQGELFGEVTLIDYQPRTATVRAVERTVLVPIPRTMMEVLLQQSDPVIRHILLVILERFRHRNDSSLTSQARVELPAEQIKQRDAVKGEATQKLALAHGMRRALAHNEFELLYQPIRDLTKGNIVGFESLIRWNHPTDGVMPPMDFLWIAEQTGLIHDIGLWTIEQACRDWPALKKLTTHDAPFVSVNISASQIGNEKFVDEVTAIFAGNGMNAAELKLELTETVMIEHPDVALKVMRTLIKMGCTFALDDYGAGHSGLRHLQKYPVSFLKIDGGIVAPILESTQSLEIVRSSIALAHSLGMRAVAESIETEAVRAKLQEMTCDFGQGWLLGKPSTVKELTSKAA